MILVKSCSNKEYLHDIKFSKEVDNYNDAINIVYQLGNILDFSNDFYASIYFDNDDISKIPKNILESCNCSSTSDAEYVSIIMTFQGLIIGLWVCNDSANILYDPFEYKMKNINKGDIVQYIPTRRYFYVIDDLNKPYNIFSLFGTEEPFCEIIDESIPMYYIRKVDDTEIKLLGIREKLEALYNKAIEVGGVDVDKDNVYDNFYHNMIEKYPWL